MIAVVTHTAARSRSLLAPNGVSAWLQSVATIAEAGHDQICDYLSVAVLAAGRAHRLVLGRSRHGVGPRRVREARGT